MPINMTRYVEIISGVGAGAAVGVRELLGRFYSTNDLIPTGAVLEFESAADVGDYFGTSSSEYLRAVFYFGWISKNITSPQKISFARWADADSPAQIFGNPAHSTLAQLQLITTGDFSLTLGGSLQHITGVDLHLAGSLAAVATALQTAVRAKSGGGVPFTAALVTYDATRGCFNLSSGVAGDDNTIAVLAGVTTDLAAPLGWLTGAIISDGLDEQSVTEVLSTSAEENDNFGSFAFMDTLTQDQIVEAATWNDGQNVKYQYSVPCTASNAAALSAALIDLSGVELTLSPLSSEYPEQVPMMILAATAYDRPNSTQNYMFQIFSLTASVTTNADANTYDALRVNYYGQTQSAGQDLSFYQRGIMCGLASDPVDQNVYANEQWLKDAAAAALMTLLLALAKISANKQGRSQILAVLQGIINQALVNGTISVGKTLNSVQKLYITNATNDPAAWQQVQTIGYWVDCVISSFVTEDNRTEWKAVYTLIYSKDDIVRKIEGTHILI